MSIQEWPCWVKIGISVMLIIFVSNWPSTSSEWAAWVQAFGSIGAIGAAIFIMNRQRKDLADFKGNDRKEALLYMLRLVDAVDFLVDGVIENKSGDKTNYREQFKNILKWMEKIDPLEKNLSGVAMSYLEVQLQVRGLVEWFDYEEIKKFNYRKIKDMFLVPKVKFELFREAAQRLSRQEGLGVQVKTRGLPKSFLNTVCGVAQREG